MLVDLFVPIAAFVTLAVMVSLLTRLVATGMLHKTIRESMRSDSKTVPMLVERLDRHAPWGDALLGVVFLALAAAMALLALTADTAEQRHDLLRATIVPVVVGIAVLIYARLSARNDPKA